MTEIRVLMENNQVNLYPVGSPSSNFYLLPESALKIGQLWVFLFLRLLNIYRFPWNVCRQYICMSFASSVKQSNCRILLISNAVNFVLPWSQDALTAVLIYGHEKVLVHLCICITFK